MSEVIKPINRQLQNIKISPCIWRGCEEVTTNGKHYHITIMFDASPWTHKNSYAIKIKIKNSLKRLPFKAWFGDNDKERLDRIRLVKCWSDYCNFFTHTSYQAKVATKPKRDKQSRYQNVKLLSVVLRGINRHLRANEILRYCIENHGRFEFLRLIIK
ncbi:hypothetical protein AB4406_11795 [Vibrio splendidus]